MAERDPSRPVRIANCSGFYGDRLAAAREMVEGGPIDVLTGDYLAELTMLILWRTRAKRPETGYATTYLRQMEEVLGTCVDRGIKVVTNAGGLNPAGCADAVRALAGTLGIEVAVAHVEGDDLLARVGEFELRHLDTGQSLADVGVEPITANAYLGGWGIAAALDAGADVVVCPRVTDAALVVGPSAWWHGWARDDWDRLAGAVVAGHVLECGAQATGGNYAFFGEVPSLAHPGFPLAEVAADGSCVVTKHPGTAGLVSVGTVTAQLLYEIAAPAYANPDVVARFDTITLTDEAGDGGGPDRVRISGVRGEPAPPDTKVCINYLGGFRNSVTFVLTGLDIDAKAELVESTLFAELGGREQFESVDVRRTGTDDGALLHVTVKDADATKVGRAFTSVAVELALASYPGFHVTAPPGDASPYGVYWPALVPSAAVDHVVVLPDGSRITIDPVAGAAGTVEVAAPAAAPLPWGGGPTTTAPLGTVAGARSGDKGGNANVGVWVRGDDAYAWLASELTVERFQQLLPETAPLEVRRYELPNLRALNFVVVGLLGEGVASSVRRDPQAKALGEQLRAQPVAIPQSLLAEAQDA